MFQVPPFVNNLIRKDNYSCPKCGAGFFDEGLTGCGIKQAYVNRERNVLYVHYCCGKCELKSFLELGEMDFADFATAIQDDATEESLESVRQSKGAKMGDKNKKQAKRKRTRSKMTKEEQKKVLDALDSAEDSKDWLSILGVDTNDGQRIDTFHIHSLDWEEADQ